LAQDLVASEMPHLQSVGKWKIYKCLSWTEPQASLILEWGVPARATLIFDAT